MNPPQRIRFRRFTLVAAALLLLALSTSLALHLHGRSRFAAAAAAFRTEVGTDLGVAPETALDDFARLETPPLAPAENAAAWLAAGSASLVWSEQEKQWLRHTLRFDLSDWSAEQRAKAGALVARNRGGLDVLHRATALERSSYGLPYSRIFEIEVPDLLILLAAANLLNAEARLAFDDGDVEDGLVALNTLMRLVDALRGEAVFIFSLVANATEKLTLQAVVEAAAAPRASLALLSDLEVLLPATDLVALGKRFVALDAAALAAGARRGYRLPFDQPPATLRGYLFGHLEAARILAEGRRAAALAEVPYGEAPERFAAVGAASTFEADYLGAVAKYQAAAAQLLLARAALKLRRKGLADGHYPARRPDLRELSVTDPFVGRPLVYERHGVGSVRLAVEGAVERIEKLTNLRDGWVFDVVLPAPGEAS